MTISMCVRSAAIVRIKCFPCLTRLVSLSGLSSTSSMGGTAP